jgi:hypothetical protein
MTSQSLVRSRPRARGQILVIVAGGMLGLFAIAGLVLEGGTIVLNRRDAQNAADLAAVAGAQVLAQRATDPSAPSSIQGVLQRSMDANGCSDAALCTWQAEAVGSRLGSLGALGATAPANAVGVRVIVTRTPGAILGRMLGLTKWKVTTEATALATKPSSAMAGTLLPMAICGWADPDTNACVRARNSPSNSVGLQPGQIYDLTAGRNASGGFGWLAWGGSSLSQSICTPNNPAFGLDGPYDSPTGGREMWFQAATGSPRVADVSGCLNQWISNRTTALVPIYDVLDEDRFHITGIAAFVLVSLGPIEDTMQGYFVQYVPFSGDPNAATTVPDANDTSVYIGLVR